MSKKETKSNSNEYISLTEASKLCAYSQEYLSLRARQGKLKAIKMGRNWVTTQEWLEDYIKQIKQIKQIRGSEKRFSVWQIKEAIKKFSHQIQITESLADFAKCLRAYKAKIDQVSITKQLIFELSEKYISQPIERGLAFIDGLTSRFALLVRRIKNNTVRVCRELHQPKFVLAVVLVILLIIGSIFTFSPGARAEFGRVLTAIENKITDFSLRQSEQIAELVQKAERSLVELPTKVAEQTSQFIEGWQYQINLGIQEVSLSLSEGLQLASQETIAFIKNIPEQIVQLAQKADQRNEQLKLDLKANVNGALTKVRDFRNEVLALARDLPQKIEETSLSLKGDFQLAFQKTILFLEQAPIQISETLYCLSDRVSDMVEAIPGQVSDISQKTFSLAKKTEGKLVDMIQDWQARLVLWPGQFEEEVKEKQEVMVQLIQGFPQKVSQWGSVQKSQIEVILGETQDTANIILSEAKNPVQSFTDGVASIIESIGNFGQKITQIPQKIQKIVDKTEDKLGEAYLKVAEFLVPGYSLEKMTGVSEGIKITKTEPSVAQEQKIVKQEAPKVTQVTEVTKEVTKEVVKVTEVTEVVQSADLTEIESQISSLDSEISTLKSQIVSKIDYTVPTYAPVYIPSSGLQVAGHAILSSLNVSGSGAIGGSLSVAGNAGFGDPYDTNTTFDVCLFYCHL
jgi:hypothetical protein